MKRRRGELSEQSLIDALASEHGDGRRPSRLVVGSSEMQLTATRILGTGGAAAAMQTVVPHVEVDGALAWDEWELREEGE